MRIMSIDASIGLVHRIDICITLQRDVSIRGREIDTQHRMSTSS